MLFTYIQLIELEINDTTYEALYLDNNPYIFTAVQVS
jgi:hypothetical protein